MPASTPRLRRPRTLIAAARAGVKLYRRDRDLVGVKKGGGLIAGLIAAEEICESERRAGSPAYSLTRHVRLLTALIAESRASKAAAQPRRAAA